MIRYTLLALTAIAGAAAWGQVAAQSGGHAGHGNIAAGAMREFTLVAEPVRWEIQPGLVVDGWGYNGATPGPTIRVTEGDLVRVRLVNQLPLSTTIHWHGIDVPISQDGVPGLSQEPVEPGQEFTYQFIATNPGTRWYHSHVDSNLQIQLGLYGAFIVDPLVPEPVTYDREFTYLLTEKALDVTPAVAMGDADVRFRDAGNGRGGEFKPDLFLMNGKSGGAIDPSTINEGERIRIRMINAGNQVHAMHLHGHSFKIIATDGNPVPPVAQLIKDTVLIGPAERYDIEVVGSNPGVWMFHCHINNHAANGMVTELVYDGSVPLAGGDHSASHGAPAQLSPAGAPPATPPPSPQPGAGSPPFGGPPFGPGHGGGPPPAAAPGNVISMTDDRFTPSRPTLKVGDTITWVNNGNNLHDTSSLDGLWTSGSFERGGSFSYTFTKPGYYAYICRQHLLQGMRGVITVE